MTDFASTEPLTRALAPLVGAETAARWIDAWLAAETARIADPVYANAFAAHFDRFDAAPLDYARRMIDCGGRRVLAGVRFYGGDPNRAFVDLVAYDGPADPTPLVASLAEAFAPFGPQALRALSAPEARPPQARLDQALHGARLSSMPPPDPATLLRAPRDLDEAEALVAVGYDAFWAAEPALAEEVRPATRADLAAAAAEDGLFVIVDDGAPAGVISVLRGAVAMVEGYVIDEEIVLPDARGRGVAARAQRALAARLSTRAPEALLLGEIQRDNAASRKTALKAGRPPLIERVFLDL